MYITSNFSWDRYNILKIILRYERYKSKKTALYSSLKTILTYVYFTAFLNKTKLFRHNGYSITIDLIYSMKLLHSTIPCEIILPSLSFNFLFTFFSFLRDREAERWRQRWTLHMCKKQRTALDISPGFPSHLKQGP